MSDRARLIAGQLLCAAKSDAEIKKAFTPDMHLRVRKQLASVMMTLTRNRMLEHARRNVQDPKLSNAQYLMGLMRKEAADLSKYLEKMIEEIYRKTDRDDLLALKDTLTDAESRVESEIGTTEVSVR